jgi:hypothetical protein
MLGSQPRRSASVLHLVATEERTCHFVSSLIVRARGGGTTTKIEG